MTQELKGLYEVFDAKIRKLDNFKAYTKKELFKL